ncbi:cell wall hydrolase [Halobacillus ihumii]|uniref:cell wall hydrolase n=1 Tax=Halobacillus ihumii TaxID=2686092 RepID=UPI0013D0738E|nr:cell wall hydrolase [Halobacillus ihumii]
MKKLFATLFAAGIAFGGTSVVSAYTVEKGDTLGDIAFQHGVEVGDIAEANPTIENVNLIYPNQEIEIPNVGQAKEVVKQPPTKTDYELTEETFDVFARLVNAEAKDESFEGKVAVAKVVLNRVESDGFPNTIQGVIFQEGQFTPVLNGAIYEDSSEAARKAVRVALNGGGDVNGALFFYAPALVDSAFMESLNTVKVIGGHVFKK